MNDGSRVSTAHEEATPEGGSRQSQEAFSRCWQLPNTPSPHTPGLKPKIECNALNFARAGAQEGVEECLAGLVITPECDVASIGIIDSRCTLQ